MSANARRTGLRRICAGAPAVKLALLLFAAPALAGSGAAAATAAAATASPGLSGKASAGQTSVQCDARLRVDGGAVTADPSGPGARVLLSPTTIALTGVSVFDGPPQEGAVLAPASARGTSLRWVFAGMDGRRG
jgi:hypothetical protein